MIKFDYPKLGIRPIIDGRRKGIREGLEDQTMQMAKVAAKLIESNIKYPDGTPVKTVIADTTIGGVYENAMCQQKFAKENICGELTVTPCWDYGVEVADLDKNYPHAVWGYNGTERPGAVTLACLMAVYTQKGIPAFGIYGHDVQDADDVANIPDDVKRKILLYAKAAYATGIMKNKSYLAIGTVAMGIGGSMINPDFWEDYFGMRNEYVDMSEIVRRWDEGIYDHDEFKKAWAWAQKYTPIGKEVYNPEDRAFSDEKKKEQFKKCVLMVMIARDLMDGNKKLADMGYKEEAGGHFALAGGFQGQRQWTDHFPNGDYMETMMNSQYDWNGQHAPHVFATESDSYNAAAMLMSRLLTNTPQIFADLRTYWSPEAIKHATGETLTGKLAGGFLHFTNSGAQTLDATGEEKIDGKPAIKPFWDVTEEEAKNNLKVTSWTPANVQYFRGGGFSSKYVTQGGKDGMPATIVRLSWVKNFGPILQVVEGWNVTLPEKVFKVVYNRTDPGWPSTFFVPRTTKTGGCKSVYDVMNNWAANHGAISYGHIGAELLTLASMLRIPVTMHNIPEDQIFRPGSWHFMGTKDLEAADVNACKTFGPLYK